MILNDFEIHLCDVCLYIYIYILGVIVYIFRGIIFLDKNLKIVSKEIFTYVLMGLCNGFKGNLGINKRGLDGNVPFC